MPTPLTLLYLVGLPLAGTLGATAALLPGGGGAPAGGPHRLPGGRMLVLLATPATLPLFGLLLLILAMAPDMGAAPPGLVEAGARGYGLPAAMAGVGMAIILWRGGPALRSHPGAFPRVLVLEVMPETAAIFGLLISLLIFGEALSAGFPLGVVEAAGRASLYALLVGAGAVAEALLIVTAWDFRTPGGWSRALVRAVAAEPLMILGLILALASLAGARGALAQAF